MQNRIFYLLGQDVVVE